MLEIIINKCYGGFGLSEEALKLYNDKSGLKLKYDGSIPRDDLNLVQVVKELGQKANGLCADLKIVVIPDGISWCIEEYDGLEWVAEQHETWS